MNKPKPAKLWPAIYSQKNRSGQCTFYVDLRAVNGGRPGFPTMPQAQTCAEQARIQRNNEGNAAFGLPLDIRLDAAKANQILAAHGITIFEAAKYYEKHVLAYKTAPTIKEIIEKYLSDAAQRNLRSRTIDDLKHRLNNFALDFGARRLSDLTLDELKDWIAHDEWEPRTRINYLTKISQLFLWAIRKKWADSNLTEQIDRPKADDTTPEIYSIEESENLLSHADKFGLLPYIAIGLFAGIRTAEMARLDGKIINFETKSIAIGADVAKKRSRRSVDICPALFSFLEPLKDKLASGQVEIIGPTFRRNRNELVEAAGLSEWKGNGLRHSFGTYHLASFRDDSETANQMGNSIEMVHKHYKAVATKEQAQRFWNLRPIAATSI